MVYISKPENCARRIEKIGAHGLAQNYHSVWKMFTHIRGLYVVPPSGHTASEIFIGK
jgi:hypothetical protein